MNIYTYGNKTEAASMIARVDDHNAHLDQFKWYAKKVDQTWYAYRALSDGRYVGMHQEVLGIKPGLLIDHIDGNGLNNTERNLRYATSAQNAHNRAKVPGKSSQFKGVILIPAKWIARIQVNGRTMQLGTFATEAEAAAAYDLAARQYFLEYACVNFPSPGERGALS